MTAAAATSAVEQAAAVLGTLAERDRPLGPLTTYRVGGPAALFVDVASEADLETVARAVSETGIETLVVGQGSNLLVADAGFDGLALHLGAAFAELDIDAQADPPAVVAGAGLPYPVLARRTAASGLSGMEWAVGVPGSVGGAVRMNAGGHGSETASTLRSARIVDLATGVDRLVPAADLDLAYRRSAVGSHDLVVSATFELQPGDTAECEARISEIVRWRRANQPGGQNAGSVFTNPPGDAAGRLADESGLKGRRIGSAEVSTKHANFIQADGGGSADDVARLIEEMRQVVLERTGVRLETELRMIGFGARPANAYRSADPG